VQYSSEVIKSSLCEVYHLQEVHIKAFYIGPYLQLVYTDMEFVMIIWLLNSKVEIHEIFPLMF